MSQELYVKSRETGIVYSFCSVKGGRWHGTCMYHPAVAGVEGRVLRVKWKEELVRASQ